MDAPTNQPPLIRGKCKWFNAERGYGFVFCDDLDRDILVHHSTIVMTGYRLLVRGQQVTVSVQECEEGLKATKCYPGDVVELADHQISLVRLTDDDQIEKLIEQYGEALVAVMMG